MNRTRWIAAITALVLLGGAITGWTIWQGDSKQQQQAEQAAEAFADALSNGQLTEDTQVPAPGADLAAVVQQMAGTRHRVILADRPALDGDRAVAQLDHRWELGVAQAWTYRTELTLRRTDDRWRPQWSPSTLAPQLRDGEKLRVNRAFAPRGDVLAGNGEPIVTVRDVVRFGIDKTRTDPLTAASSARLLAVTIGIDTDDFAKQVGAAGPKAFVSAITLRPEDPLYARAASVRAPGVAQVKDRLPLAPTSTFARPILGTVGEATAEIVENSNGTVRPGDQTGLSGLQLSYQDRLGGSPGIDVQAVDANGQVRSLYHVDPVAGQPVRTTIDLQLQVKAEAKLAALAPASAIVAIRPSDGAVLAVASGKGGNGQSTATLGQFAPGSTFKVVTALALLRNGVAADTPVECPPTITVDGRSFKNHDGYPASALGNVRFGTAFANSCNTAMIGQRQKLQGDSLVKAAQSLGMTGQPQLGIKAYLGDVPGTGGQTDIAATTIGQGRVLASPLGMATVAASVASGKRVTPKLVLDPATPTPDPPASPLTEQESTALRQLMRGVVTSGSATVLRDVPGEVFAKTGTAEFGDANPPKAHAWMIAVKGDLAVAVFVGEGVSGSATAGPIMQQFLREAG